MELKADKRETTGKATRRLRHAGLLPAVVYGHNASPTSVQLDAHEFERVFSRSGRTQLIDLVVDRGRPHKVLVKEVQRSPRKNTFVHVDFHQVSLRERLQVDVPVVVTGQAEPVATGDADVLVVMHSLKVECLPTVIPEAVEVDISGLTEVEAGIRVSELRLPEGVAAVADPDELVVKLAARRVAAVEEVEEEAAEAAAEGEGEAAAAEEEAPSEAEPSESAEAG
ncbi:MAG: 50S ribosomal protein L25 [Candidatus Dormibacteraeota bacterium]|nr:50S ribosomal protein L25 [Candidatus Dormibacteraeota bacterium]